MNQLGITADTFLLAVSILIFIGAVLWHIVKPGFEPFLAVLAAISGLIGWFIARNLDTDLLAWVFGGLLVIVAAGILVKSLIKRPEQPDVSLNDHDRRVILDKVEKHWVKGILEKSLHGLAMIELGMEYEPGKVKSHPWEVVSNSGNPLPSGKSMLDIFLDEGKEQSLLILGEAGSGKTTMLLELARQWIERARDNKDEPIPVVFNLSSWDGKQTIVEWLIKELGDFYQVDKVLGNVLVSGKQLFFLLDGLDEVKEERRNGCVDAINEFYVERKYPSVVVCCRREDYEALEKQLDFEGAISLQPLSPEQVDEYINLARGQLIGVQTLLHEDPVLRELTETPLMLSIMTLAYKGMSADNLRGFPTIEAWREHLFKTYVERMFERPERPGITPPHSKEKILDWLAWLARKLTQHDQAVYLIERMQPIWLDTTKQRHLYRSSVTLVTGLISGLGSGWGVWLGGEFGAGLLIGLFEALTSRPVDSVILELIGWPLYGPTARLVFGPIGGFSIGLLAGLALGIRNETIMVKTVVWSWEKAKPRLASGLIIWLVGIVVVPAIGQIAGLSATPLNRLLAGIFILLVVGLGVGLTGGQIGNTSTPNQGIRQSLRDMLIIMGSVGLITGLILGLVSGLIVGQSDG